MNSSEQAVSAHSGAPVALSVTVSPSLSEYLSASPLVNICNDRTLSEFRQSMNESLRIPSERVSEFQALQRVAQSVTNSITVPGVSELLTALNTESVREVSAVKARMRHISRGQASIALRTQLLLARLDDLGKSATAMIMAQALRGDQEALESLREGESSQPEYVEFFAILAELSKLEQAQLELAQDIAALPDYPLHSECSVPQFIKQPEQVLRGAVNPHAPTAVPADITRSGYAVGCLA